MSPILRHAPGEGDMFPLLGVSAEAGPLWYVRLYIAAEATKAA
jgi:hypothetical protein